jgi:hypothetical protein
VEKRGTLMAQTRLLGSICPNCGVPAKPDSIFCTNCGQALKTAPQNKQAASSSSENPYITSAGNLKTQTTPPIFDVQTGVKKDNSAMTVISVVGGVVLLMIGIIVIASLNKSDSNINANRSNSNATRNTGYTNMGTTATSSNTIYNSASTSMSGASGRIGRLIKDLNIRSAPNNQSLIIGTHYQDAQVQIVDEDSFQTKDGYATWYKVKVLQDGCSTADRSRCGNNWERDDSFGWMEAATEGWMNAKHITLE